MRLTVAAGRPQTQLRNAVFPSKYCCYGRRRQGKCFRPQRSSARVTLAQSQMDLDEMLQSLEIADDLQSMQEKLGGVFQVRVCSFTLAVEAEACGWMKLSTLIAQVSTRPVANAE